MWRRSCALTLALFALAAASARADCKALHRSDRVVLYSSSEDPDVLLWDSRVRMRDYEDGSFDEMNQLLPHARVVSQGTRAVVELCVPGFVAPQYAKTPEDAIGVIVATGPLRGKFGWVLSSDVRVLQRSTPGPHP